MNFNPKQYRGKKRIYIAVKGLSGISKIYIWNPNAKKYEPPVRGSIYIARRRTLVLGKGRMREYGHFNSREEALDWQSASVRKNSNGGLSMRFSSVVEQWRQKKLSQREFSTKIHYEKMLRLYFDRLMPIEMRGFDVQVVDAWIDHLKDPSGPYMRSSRRVSFDHELSLLRCILNFYREYIDDTFHLPVLKRHAGDVQTGRKRSSSRKDITEEEFYRFRSSLLKLYDPMFAALASVQYFQGHRIYESAALHWEDLQNLHDPRNAKIVITKSIVWPRVKGIESFIQIGFKNSKANDGMKVQPVFPETYDAIMQLYRPGVKGLVFQKNGSHLEYRSIEHAYNRALKDAGVPLTATHILRHGATCRLYNRTKGDLEVAGQLLGNTDRTTILTYAKRDPRALNLVADKEWEDWEKQNSHRAVVAIDSKY